MKCARAASCRLLIVVSATMVIAPRMTVAEDRSYDGSGNSTIIPSRGAAGTPVIRVSYRAAYGGPNGAMHTDAQRPNSRTLSNVLNAQSNSRPSDRGLSDYAWAWGQFLDHDMSLSTSSNGAAVNGAAPIAINDPLDPLGPNPIPFVRSNFVNLNGREQINEVTSWIDASQVYGSNAARAASLRTDGGVGAKLTMSAEGLLPRNTIGLPNDNDGPLPDDRMFLAGDVRANENLLLTSLQTVFAREHNRLVDRIAQMQPGLTAEQQFQLARKLVGAEVQAITYREFLPALMGSNAPKAENYVFISAQNGSVTNSFAHSAYRFGHSTLSPNLKLAADDGTPVGSVPLRNAFFNPDAISDDPGLVDQLLQGAAIQTSQEVDLQIIDDVRNFLFGPPGAGGLDLAALNISRGRDHGLPAYGLLRSSYSLPFIQSFAQMPADPAVRQALSDAYGGNFQNIDPWIGGLAETHLPGSSVGPLIDAILRNQFTRSRDGDRLFYRGAAAGLYLNGTLDPSIAELVDLDSIRLSDVILANTQLTTLQENVFFAWGAADFNHDGQTDGLDMAIWQDGFAGASAGDADFDGDVDGNDFLVLQRQLQPSDGGGGPIPEPRSEVLIGVACWIAIALSSRRRHAF